MGDVDRLPSGKWQARWRDDAGRQRKASYRTKALALQHLADVRHDLARGQYVDARDGRQLVKEYGAQWLAGRPHRDTTAARTESMLRLHLFEQDLGRMPLAAVRPSMVQAWASDRAKVLAPSTLRVLVALTSSTFNGAVLDRMIGTSPVVRLTLPRDERAKVVPLTTDQVEQLAAAMKPERCRAAVYAQAGLGLRISEVLALQAGDVDWLGRVVRVRYQLDRKGRLTELKTPSSRRDIPLAGWLSEVLAAHVGKYSPGQVTYAKDGSPGEVLFSGEKGGPLRQDLYGVRAFGKAVAAAKLPEGTTPHDLRHHFASILLAAGESVVRVSELLGHSDGGALVLKVYGHVIPGGDDRTRRALEAAWRPESAPDVPQAGESGR